MGTMKQKGTPEYSVLSEDWPTLYGSRETMKAVFGDHVYEVIEIVFKDEDQDGMYGDTVQFVFNYGDRGKSWMSIEGSSMGFKSLFDPRIQAAVQLFNGQHGEVDETPENMVAVLTAKQFRRSKVGASR